MGNGSSQKKKELEPQVYKRPLVPPTSESRSTFWSRSASEQRPTHWSKTTSDFRPASSFTKALYPWTIFGHGREYGSSRQPNFPSRPPIGIGLIGSIHPSQNIVQELALPPPAPRVIQEPYSSKLFKANYNNYKQDANLIVYDNRVKQNATDAISRGQEVHEFRLKRIEETSKLYIDRKTNDPPPSIYSCIDIKPRLESIRVYDSKYFSTEKKRPELTPQMLSEISEASRAQPLNETLVEIDGVQILRKDIQTLLGFNWLNDEIVNAYMNLIVLRGGKSNYRRVYSFNTFFYPKLRETGYSSIRRWTRKVDIFSYDYVLVPIHLGNHWCLALIDFKTRTISYYDSLGGHPNGCCDTLLDYLREEHSDKKKQEFDIENWNLIDKYHSEGIPQQKNGADCGVFACTYAEYLTRQAKLKFGQENMPYFRRKMIYEIIKKQILE